LEIVALPQERRAEALEKATRVYAALAEALGTPESEALVFALGMRRLIGEAVLAIEISGGGAGGMG
jgi:hypothetical protein